MVIWAAPEVSARCRVWPVLHDEVHGCRGEFEILRGGCRSLHGGLATTGRVLGEPHTVEGVYLLKLVLAGEIQDDAACIAPHGLGPALLDVNLAGHGCGAQQVLLSCENKLSLVGATVHLGRLRSTWVGVREAFRVRFWMLRGLHTRFGDDVSRGQNPFHMVVMTELEDRADPPGAFHPRA